MKKYFPYIQGLLALGIFIGVSGGAEARSLQEIKQTKSLIVGIDGTIPPFQYKVNNKYVGFEIEIAKAIATDLGADLVIKANTDFAAQQADLNAGKVDFLISTIAITSTRDNKFDFSRPYACLGAALLTVNPALKTHTDLKGKTVGVTANSVFVSYLQKLPFDKTIKVYPDGMALASDFTAGKIDTSVAWKSVIPFASQVYEIKFQETPVLWSIPVGIMMDNANSSLRFVVNSSLSKFIAGEKYNTMAKIYFPNENIKCSR